MRYRKRFEYREFLRSNPYYDPERGAQVTASHPPASRVLEAKRDPLLADMLYRVVPEGAIATRKRADDRKEIGHKAASIAAAVSKFTERDFASPEKRREYRRLRAAQEQQRARKSPLVDERRFAFNKSAARALGLLKVVGGFTSGFKTASRVLPCVQRMTRREVLFAKGRGGKGYRTPHHRSWKTGVPC